MSCFICRRRYVLASQACSLEPPLKSALIRAARQIFKACFVTNKLARNQRYMYFAPYTAHFPSWQRCSPLPTRGRNPTEGNPQSFSLSPSPNQQTTNKHEHTNTHTVASINGEEEEEEEEENLTYQDKRDLILAAQDKIEKKELRNSHLIHFDFHANSLKNIDELNTQLFDFSGPPSIIITPPTSTSTSTSTKHTKGLDEEEEDDGEASHWFCVDDTPTKNKFEPLFSSDYHLPVDIIGEKDWDYVRDPSPDILRRRSNSIDPFLSISNSHLLSTTSKRTKTTEDTSPPTCIHHFLREMTEIEMIYAIYNDISCIFPNHFTLKHRLKTCIQIIIRSNPSPKALFQYLKNTSKRCGVNLSNLAPHPKIQPSEIPKTQFSQ